MTADPSIAQEMQTLIGMPVIERAIRCVRDAALCLEPSPWPTRPPSLMSVYRDDLKAIATRVMDGKRGEQDHDFDAMQTWMAMRANIRAVNESRLRGLLWCIATLERAEDEGDARATGPLKAARTVLTTKWGMAIERNASLTTRTQLTSDCVEFMHKEQLR